MKLYTGHVLNVLPTLPERSVQCVLTSPPYWGLRKYAGEQEVVWPDGWKGALGLEPTPALYVQHLVGIFRALRRVLRDDGTVWLNLGDSYNGSGGAGGDYNEGGLKEGQPRYPGRKVGGLKPKDLVGIPWRVAFALQEDGWWLRSDIIWAKPNPMPESVTDRPTRSHEYIFLLTKAARYYYDAEAVKESSITDPASKAAMTFGSLAGKNNTAEKAHSVDVGHKWEYTPTRNLRSVWTFATQPYPEAHFATFPPELPRRCILASTRPRDIVLDPFCGSGTTIQVAEELNREGWGIDISQEYRELQLKRLAPFQGQTRLLEPPRPGGRP